MCVCVCVKVMWTFVAIPLCSVPQVLALSLPDFQLLFSDLAPQKQALWWLRLEIDWISSTSESWQTAGAPFPP